MIPLKITDRFVAILCCLIALSQPVRAQSSQPAWQEEAQGLLISRSDTVIISWPNDTLTVSMGKTNDGFDPDTFASDVVCETLLQAGKPENNAVMINIYTLMLDRFEWHAEPSGTYICN